MLAAGGNFLTFWMRYSIKNTFLSAIWKHFLHKTPSQILKNFHLRRAFYKETLCFPLFFAYFPFCTGKMSLFPILQPDTPPPQGGGYTFTLYAYIPKIFRLRRAISACLEYPNDERPRFWRFWDHYFLFAFFKYNFKQFQSAREVFQIVFEKCIATSLLIRVGLIGNQQP